MTNTNDLIKALSAQVTPVKRLRPRRYATFLLILLLVYAFCAQCWLDGFRSDLLLQLKRPLFIVELLMLFAMLITASIAAVYAMLPDSARQKKMMRLPYVFSAGMFALVMIQLLSPPDARMVMNGLETHECTLYIALSSLIPAALIFVLLRKGASVMPMQAGLLALIAAVSVGAITLRLAEANDDIIHLLSWHYLPSIFFASLGALMGRFLLRW